MTVTLTRRAATTDELTVGWQCVYELAPFKPIYCADANEDILNSPMIAMMKRLTGHTFVVANESH